MPRVLRNFLIVYLLLHLLAAGLFVGKLTGTIRQMMTENMREQMLAMANGLDQHVAELEGNLSHRSLPEYLTKLGQKTNFRLTLLDSNGKVAADSETGTRDIGPLGDQPEILAATLEKEGFEERYSATSKMRMVYLAIPLAIEAPNTSSPETIGFVRIARPAAETDSAIYSAQRYFWIFAISLGLLTGIFMMIFASQSMKPLGQFADTARKIGEGEYGSFPTLLNRNDEWRSLADAFRSMQSEMERREMRIVKNRDRLQAVLSSMIEGVVSVSPTMEVRIANRAACRMLDLKETELKGRNFLEVVRSPDLALALEKAQNEQSFSATEFQRANEFSRRTISASASVLPSQENEPPGVVIVLHDITELRNLETMRRDFVANVSHELKTPLASIKAYAETLKLGAVNDSERNLEFVQEIEQQADFLNQQIQDLLQLARVESGNQVWDIERVDLNVECQRCVNKFAPLAAKSQIELSFEERDESPGARADVDGIQTLLGNLISNALNYTSAGGHVRVTTYYHENSAVLEVSDSGIGIAPEHHARIFERFYRVDKDRSRDKGGTGLGLSIVKHLAQSFGGSVELESESGKGTTFRIRLPKFVQ